VPRPRHIESGMQKIEFQLEHDFVELNQLLKLTGLCGSGGAGKALVSSGEVSVDGKQELRKTAKIRAGQRVCMGDMEIEIVATA
jgi:ribosome-associated protein